MNNLGTVLLETERVLLRRIEEDDYKEMYHNWACLEECCAFFPWSSMKDIDAYKEKVMSWISNYEDSLYFQWLIELKEKNEVIGIINLHNVDEICNSAETSYILSPGYWGKGIMTETLRCVLQYAFDKLELNRVCADVFEGNAASERVLKKCGMKQEGIAREKYCKNGAYIDSIQYAILRRDWYAAQLKN